MKIRRILVPVDFSPTSLQAVDYAVALSKQFGAELHLLAVVEPMYPLMPDYAGVQSAAVGQVIEENRAAAQAGLARLEKRYARRVHRLRVQVTVGRPFEAIGQYARRAKADLIVMATHGRTGVAHLFAGSVAERVVRTAPCPVLTVRPPGAARRRRAR